jgi:putative spermidine/putrescine transport system ATP-binding protein
MNAQPSQPVAIRLQNVKRYFGGVRAVDDLTLDIYEGEFFCLLGPSGSGKTTCLRLIAGFEQPTAGSIALYGQEMAGVPPYDRDVNTVFQDYALFPHMTIEQNIAYGLMVKGVDKNTRQRKVQEMLNLVRLPEVGKRKPSQLSGGQRQRVALARALVNQPRVLLLDEPLGALDLKLRQEMQVELKTIQQQVGITFIFVTHDQEEALTMSDRIAVFNHGKIEQVGDPSNLYERPETTFVANFVGTSNILEGEVAQTLLGQAGKFALRPEKISLLEADQSAPPNHILAEGVITDAVYLGIYTRYEVMLAANAPLTVVQQNMAEGSAQALAKRGKTVQVMWDKNHIHPLHD